MKRRDARKQQIESNRVQMQEGIKQQLEKRRKGPSGRDIDAEMAVIDQETEAKNKTVDTSKEEQFKENEVAGLARQKTLTTRQLVSKGLSTKCVKRLALPAKLVANRPRIAQRNAISKLLQHKPSSTLPLRQPTTSRWKAQEGRSSCKCS